MITEAPKMFSIDPASVVSIEGVGIPEARQAEGWATSGIFSTAAEDTSPSYPYKLQKQVTSYAIFP